VIWANGKPAYDEAFKDGANIIRGKNSSGKSTIADFIFFALGGDFAKWKHEASLCDFVMAEIEINEVILTIKRRVEASNRQPMMIFWGTYAEANASAVEGWQVFPFQRGRSSAETSSKDSFSQTLFRTMEFPEVRGDFDSNITMHQVLRLIFVDQLSPVDSLLRMEQFDSALTRNTIGDLLLGSYDDSVMQVFSEAEQETDLNVINTQIADLNEQRGKVIQSLKNAEQLEVIHAVDGSIIEKLRSELVEHQQSLAALEAENETQTFEVEDSQEFVKSLNARITALDDSNLVRTLLGELPLKNCPHCLAPIIFDAGQATTCPLCKESQSKDVEASHAARMRQELAQQIKESELLLVKRQKNLDQIRRKLPSVQESVKRAAKNYDSAINTAKSNRDAHIDKLWMTMGELDAKIEYLHKYARGISVLSHLKERKITVESEISRLGLFVRERINKQQARKIEAYASIEQKALYLLHNDLPLEGAFKSATSVSFDFSTNSFAVNGENQFSASSMVYLKNSIHFAIFWASLELPFFRYPRLFISDDIEDKGMHPVRSQNFQRVIVGLSQEFKVSHQLIFTTSMIDPELDKTDMCIGPSYGPNNKTLKLV
jgi:hypothetical protein